MSRGDWLHVASIGGVIALGALAFVGPLVVHVDQPVRQTEAGQSSKQIEPPIPSPCALYEDVKERAACQRNEADLQAQQKMGDAAWAAVGVSVLALFGLGATVWFARKAWLAARDSAKSDNEALKLTRTQLEEARTAAEEAQRISRNQSRAYLHVSGAWLDYSEEVTGIAAAVLRDVGADPAEPVYSPKLKLRIQNVGQTATTFLSYYAVVDQEASGSVLRVTPLPDPGANNKLSNLAPQSSRVIEAQIYSLDATLEQQRKKPIRGTVGGGLLGRMPDHFTVRGRVRYIDVFGQRFESEFGFFCYPPTPGIRTKMAPMFANFPIYAERTTPERPAPPEPIPDEPLPPGAVVRTRKDE